MKIVYKYIATDGTTEKSSLSHCTHSYSVYPALFVASYSKFALWENDGKIWE